MLANTNLFYREVTKPSIFNLQNKEKDPTVINCIRVLFEDPGVSSLNLSLQFKSWPAFAKRFKYLSALHGPVPDMILPGEFKQLNSSLLDQTLSLKLGNEYRT